LQNLGQQNDISIPAGFKPGLDTQTKNVYISTYGCQMNVSDTDRMYSLLEMANYQQVDSVQSADLIIINACSVREKPVQKVYSEAGRYKKLKQKNPHLKIGVGGCVGNQEKGALIKNQPLIDFVFGTDNIDELPSILANLDDLNKPVNTQFRHREPYHIETLIKNPGVATFVNITKGCDNFCTFCVVPFTRGRLKSRPLEHIVEDVKKLVSRGVKEVTLLGQNVNSYESTDGSDFADLLKAVSQKTDIERVRYTTSHPKDFNQKLVEVIESEKEKVCEYIHLPFQSGSDPILAQMNRGYTHQEYLDKIAMIKKAIPNVVLSTDIIVGFPGETEEDFQQTLKLLTEVGYETVYAFKYSPRPFTKAEKFENQIDEATKDDRLARLFAHQDNIAFKLAEKYDGQVLDVLFEKYNADVKKLVGRSRQNKLVSVLMDSPERAEKLVGQTLKVKILKAFPSNMRGELIN
jgi:tRNA-2-methylthio-N6-dimethylallyladenosine synthase